MRRSHHVAKSPKKERVLRLKCLLLCVPVIAWCCLKKVALMEAEGAEELFIPPLQPYYEDRPPPIESEFTVGVDWGSKKLTIAVLRKMGEAALQGPEDGIAEEFVADGNGIEYACCRTDVADIQGWDQLSARRQGKLTAAVAFCATSYFPVYSAERSPKLLVVSAVRHGHLLRHIKLIIGRIEDRREEYTYAEGEENAGFPNAAKLISFGNVLHAMLEQSLTSLVRFSMQYLSQGSRAAIEQCAHIEQGTLYAGIMYARIALYMYEYANTPYAVLNALAISQKENAIEATDHMCIEIKIPISDYKSLVAGLRNLQTANLDLEAAYGGGFNDLGGDGGDNDDDAQEPRQKTPEARQPSWSAPGRRWTASEYGASQYRDEQEAENRAAEVAELAAQLERANAVAAELEKVKNRWENWHAQAIAREEEVSKELEAKIREREADATEIARLKSMQKEVEAKLLRLPTEKGFALAGAEIEYQKQLLAGIEHRLGAEAERGKQLAKERDQLAEERDAAMRERDEYVTELNRLNGETQQLAQAQRALEARLRDAAELEKKLAQEREAAIQKSLAEGAEIEQLKGALQEVKDRLQQLDTQRGNTEEARNQAAAEIVRLTAQRNLYQDRLRKAFAKENRLARQREAERNLRLAADAAHTQLLHQMRDGTLGELAAGHAHDPEATQPLHGAGGNRPAARKLILRTATINKGVKRGGQGQTSKEGAKKEGPDRTPKGPRRVLVDADDLKATTGGNENAASRVLAAAQKFDQNAAAGNAHQDANGDNYFDAAAARSAPPANTAPAPEVRPAAALPDTPPATLPLTPQLTPAAALPGTAQAAPPITPELTPAAALPVTPPAAPAKAPGKKTAAALPGTAQAAPPQDKPKAKRREREEPANTANEQHDEPANTANNKPADDNADKGDDGDNAGGHPDDPLFFEFGYVRDEPVPDRLLRTLDPEKHRESLRAKKLQQRASNRSFEDRNRAFAESFMHAVSNAAASASQPPPPPPPRSPSPPLDK